MRLIDLIASRYHTDPWAVLHWPPERLGVAMVCIDARGDRLKGKDVQPVVLL